MEYVALTGISHEVVTDLKNHGLRTIEIRSPHNFFTTLNLNVGENIFLTSTSTQDLTAGTKGIIVKLMQHQVSTHRIINGTDNFYEEREMTMIRIQLQSKCVARVRKVLSNQIGQITLVDAEEMSFYDAR